MEGFPAIGIEIDDCYIEGARSRLHRVNEKLDAQPPMTYEVTD